MEINKTVHDRILRFYERYKTISGTLRMLHVIIDEFVPVVELNNIEDFLLANTNGNDNILSACAHYTMTRRRMSEQEYDKFEWS